MTCRPEAGPLKHGLFGRLELQRAELAHISESAIPARQLRTDAQPWIPKHRPTISKCAPFLPRATAGSDGFGARFVSSTASRTTLTCGGASRRNPVCRSSGTGYDQFTAASGAACSLAPGRHQGILKPFQNQTFRSTYSRSYSDSQTRIRANYSRQLRLSHPPLNENRSN